MALAKVYDTEDTLMVPMSIDDARDAVADIRWLAVNRPESVNSWMLTVEADIREALTAAGIDA